MEKLKRDMRFSDVQAIAGDLDAVSLKGLIRCLAIILNEKEPVEECPICQWKGLDAAHNMLHSQSR